MTIQTDHRDGRRCPACDANIEASTGQSVPRPGATGVCVYCRTFLVFTEAHPRIMTNSEWAALPEDLRVLLTSLRSSLLTEQIRGTIRKP